MSIDTLLKKLDETAEKSLKAWNLAGFSVAVVKDGKVAAVRGYGLRDEEKQLPVESSTVMPVGSISKSFTSLVLAQLVDEGKLTWDEPIKTYLPDLKLWDKEAEEKVTLRDLCSHNSGFAGYSGYSVYCSKDDRAEAVKDLEFLETSHGFRSRFEYSNQNFVLAAHVAEAVTGKTWEELVRERVFVPAGMNSTSVSAAELEEVENRSVGYIFNGQANMAQPYLELKSQAPAGGINSNAEDMAKYMLIQLGDTKGFCTEESLKEMHSVQVNGTPYPWQLEELTEARYGLGWDVDTYRGLNVINHGGNILGFSAMVSLVPAEDLGFAILTNGTSNFMSSALTYTLLDAYLETEGPDWDAKMAATIGEIFGAMAQAAQQKAADQVQGTELLHEPADYAGTYEAPGLGTMVISESEGTLSGVFNGYQAMLNRYHYETFDVLMLVYGMSSQVTFKTGDSGEVEGFECVLEPTVKPVFFRKK